MKFSNICLIPTCKQPTEILLDLGRSPLANALIKKGDITKSTSFPLQLGRCVSCGHVQLMTISEPEEMFKDYLYISSVSSTLKQHLESISGFISNRIELKPEDLCVDIGSNDGTLLSGFRKRGIRCLGIDPAENLVALAKKNNVETYTGYFGAETAFNIKSKFGQAKVITSTNTFPHIQDLGDFMKGIDILLHIDGLLFIEAHYLQDIYDQVAFDTIYHEHVSYWHLHPIKELFSSFGITIEYVERLPLHHGQLRIVASKTKNKKSDSSVAKLMEEEKISKINSLFLGENFARKALLIKNKLNSLIKTILKEGKSIGGYGAPAKATTLLNFLELDDKSISFIADMSPLKQGLFVPGTQIEIVNPDFISNQNPDYLIIFAWNFLDEITKQLSGFLDNGGKFIIPLPGVKIYPE